VHCDYFLPSEKLGSTRAPLVYVRGGVSYAVIFEGATGLVQQGGQRSTVAELIAAGGVEPCPELAGAVMVVLAAGTSVQMAHNGMSFYVASVAAGRRFAAPLLSAGSMAGALMVGLSFLVHTGLLAGFAFFKPTLGGVDDEEAHRERVLLMQQLIKSTQDPEQEAEQAKESSEGGDAKQGARAKDAEGAMGKKDMAAANQKWGKEGPRDNKEPMLEKTRGERIAEAREFGIIGMLNQIGPSGGDPSAPTAAWGRDLALGADDKSADGAFFGSTIGDSGGSGGLGMSGIGIGGGGDYNGIGLSSIGTIGSSGTCVGANCSGVGGTHGRMQGDHKVSAPKMTPGSTVLKGRLPAEVVQRVIRQNFGRFRACYEGGLRNNPSLAGRVAVRFVIGRDGAVANVGNGGSDLPDSAVVSCVVRSFGGLSFPAPEDGIVTVVYPITFAPGTLRNESEAIGPSTVPQARQASYMDTCRAAFHEEIPGKRAWTSYVARAYPLGDLRGSIPRSPSLRVDAPSSVEVASGHAAAAAPHVWYAPSLRCPALTRAFSSLS
jgi:hypothetical protein